MQKKRARAAGALLCVFALPLWAQAEPSLDGKQLQTTIVTAKPDPAGPTLTQPNLRVARERIGNVPGGATVVDAEEANSARAMNMADSFRYTAGVLALPRFGAEETRLSIRGSGIQRTFHLRGVLLMQDGVPLNQADGGGDFQSIEPLATRYMEVYRGANALQYGSTTLGGAINYVSPTGYGAEKLGARLEAGSYEYLRTQVSGGGVAGDWDYYGSFSTFSQNGFRNHAVQEGLRINTNAGYRFHEDAETRFYFAWTSSNSELPGNLTKEELKDDPRRANGNNVTSDNRRDTDTIRIANRTVWRFGDNRIEASAYYSGYELFHPIFQVLDQDAYTAGGELRFVSESKLAARRNLFIAGYAPVRGRTDEDRFDNVRGQKGARRDKNSQVATSDVFYFENSHYVLPDVAVVLGAQRSHATRDRNDYSGADDSFEESYSATSPKFGLLYRVERRVQLFANVSKSFEPPSFSEGVVTAEPNKAQRGWTYEIGTRGETAAIHWDLAIYHAELRDELLGVSVGPMPGQVLTVNVPRTVHQGIEAAAGGRAGAFHWQAAALYNRFRFDNDPVYGNNTLPGLPELLLRAEVLYRPSAAWELGPTVEWSPRSYPVDMANSLHADSYAIWGFKIGSGEDKHLRWFIEARNIFDKRYASTTGVIRDAVGADAAQFLPGDGRSVFAGVQWRL
jgi:iron complex outermembrane recepter protein